MTDSLPGTVLGLLVAGGVVYVVLRSAAARRRGEDPVAAAADALREVGPPLVLVGVAVVAASALATLAAVMFLIGMIEVLAGRDDGLNTALLLLLLSGMVLFGGASGALVWVVTRVRRNRR